MSEINPYETLADNLIKTLLEDVPENYTPTQRSDEVFWQLSEIEEQNGLYPLEFDMVYNAFVQRYNGGIS